MIRLDWVKRAKATGGSNNCGDFTDKAIEIGLITSLVTIGVIHTSDVLNQTKDKEFAATLNSPEQVILHQGQNTSFRDAIINAEEYQKSIEALQTPLDANSTQVKAQGFAIHPINEYRRQTRPELSQSRNTPPEIQSPKSLNSEVRKATTYIKELTSRFLDEEEPLYTNVKKTSIRRTEKPYFSIDQTNKGRLLSAANTLNLGTPRTVAKKTLGKPNKETLVADPESRQLVKMLVYTITLWKQGTPTPQRDEFIVLLFDSSDQLIALEHSPDSEGGRKENKFNPYSYEPPQYAFNAFNAFNKPKR